MLLWDHDNKMISAISVNVVHDLDGLKRKFSEVLPGQAIRRASALHRAFSTSELQREYAVILRNLSATDSNSEEKQEFQQTQFTS